MEKDYVKAFVDEIYSKARKKKYPTNKIIYNHIDEIWSIDLADFWDDKTSNNKGFRYIFIIIDKFSKYMSAIPIKNKISKTITGDFSKILTSSEKTS